MAELVGGAFLSATLQVAFDRLASRDILDYFRGRKLNEGLLKRLHIILISINQVLEDAEESQYRNPNVKQWLDELKDAVFIAEDLLDEIATEASRQKLESEYRATTSKILLSNKMSSSEPPMQVITIVGMGGVGKTTLAQLVYNDKRMEDLFQLKAWVCVSEEFNVVQVTKAILEAVACSTKEFNDLNLLQLQLRERLMGKKFFLVLDDVWNENRTTWEILQAPFNYGARGSKIFVTTRNKKVASVMHSAHIHHLKPLAEEDSWKLFAKHAFNDQLSGMDSNLVSIGRKIVKKCGGLPLAIKTLGSMLHREQSCQEWANILESDIWHLSEDDSNIIPALRLSYHYLPSNLKCCFSFCSVFPKDYEIDKDLLIQLWMAEGLVHSWRKDRSIEEVGNEFFNDLESRSFFEPSRRRNGRYFIMHDLLNDLAKSVMGEFCFLLDSNSSQNIHVKTRYFSYLSTNDLKYVDSTIFNCNHLRSFLPLKLNNPISCNVMGNLFSRLDCLKYLRMLSLSGYKNVKELVDDLSNLKHLRYLDISFTSIKELPNSICLLINLQTLKLVNCCHLTELPSDLHKLINLRHLDLRGTSIQKMPEHMGKLEHLRTLTRFVVGKNRGSDMKELGKLSYLRGTISILILDSVIDPIDAKEANMKEKKYLEELVLEWCKSNEDSQHERCILESFQPNKNLKKLTINFYNGTRFPNWFEAPYLPNLVSLQLSGSNYCFCLPPLGQLPCLKQLQIYKFVEIELIGPEFYGDSSSGAPFRCLECLTFSHMKQWEEWNTCYEGESFPCLQELQIWNCRKLRKSLPQFLPSLKILNISNCENLEAPLPNAFPLDQLMLSNCKISLHDVPNSLTSMSMSGIRINESCLNHILLSNPSLGQLYLSSCDELVSPSISGIGFSTSKLTSMFFDKLSNLKSLPDDMHIIFPYLHSLTLWDCPELESLPLEGLPPSLVELTIIRCPKLFASRMSWGLHKLFSLRHITFSVELESEESFPEEALLPPNVTSLTMKNCSNLKSINYKGLLHLKFLESLCVWDCPLLCPQGLLEKGLPKSLLRLEIWGNCPLLKEQFQEEKGQGWPELSHIPHVCTH
ncbi:putative disease resistance RPP13-like protein 1 [Prosopis cineraria]|uniref:putative disease resistance RPP13-like protein 1 n=1 Tax=Prosopis cineraria TaxID=364024 RepID=UPI00240EB038|nr:putative disease resistance RPP13-like protein 1 [Prosopis cineraria]XP_054794270.1 putative disease resistance RPP13-like protein 1 [Prosopis cineraria]XP_054794272.1 putative disease resistance RPP13-like protein 1 [Prosopis cineraria]